jgi:hypothetical protein
MKTGIILKEPIKIFLVREGMDYVKTFVILKSLPGIEHLGTTTMVRMAVAFSGDGQAAHSAPMVYQKWKGYIHRCGKQLGLTTRNRQAITF